ncbi:MAG: potassium-transporting ATPase subunit KdpC [Burkholderiaceae bacterium]|nr:potassium-transporting ATPase subunit KdpC [Burkholderiaceae bacterium]
MTIFSTYLRPVFSLFLGLSLLTGLIYPLLVTAIGKAAFNEAATGSLIVKEGKMLGSALIGQNFSEPGNFWGRLSATAPMPYNAAASSGSNLAASNPALINAAKTRIEALKAADPNNPAPIPLDLITASASGLDPEISPAAAQYQLTRVARARKLPPEQLQALIKANTQGRQWGVFGEPRINVLRLNLALNAITNRP